MGLPGHEVPRAWLAPRRGSLQCRRRRRLPLRDRVMDDGQPDLSAGDALPQMARQALEANQLELVLS
jgi:hypothetical protein